MMEGLIRKLVPAEEIAGIEITDSAVRLAMLSVSDLRVLVRGEVLIPQGIISSGEVKRIGELTKVFQDLRRQAPYFSKNPLAVLTLPSSSFFIHLLSIPEVAEGTYGEAARLNATQLSPIKLEDAYFDWQNVGVNLKTQERELLIGVASESRINPYLLASRQSGITPVAVEPNSLSLLRLLNNFAPVFEKTAPHLIIYISQDGLNLLIGREGKPLFDEFLFWRDIPEAKDGKVSRDDFESVLLREVKRLINFYTAHYEENIRYIVFLSPTLKNELAKILSDIFKVEVLGLRFPAFGGVAIGDLWAGALGAALRGVIPRKSDTIISLMQPGTEEAYAQTRAVNFVSLWAKVTSGVLLGLSLAVAIAAGVIFQLDERLTLSYTVLQAAPPSREIAEIEKEVAAFNQLVNSAFEAEKSSTQWSGWLEPIVVASGRDILFDRISISALASEIRMQVRSKDRSSALSFKKKLEEAKIYSRIDLPIASFVPTADGIAFTITVHLK